MVLSDKYACPVFGTSGQMLEFKDKD
jgi:hypothetical protein